jgi:hypothetical protein
MLKVIFNSNNQVVSSSGYVIPDLHLLDLTPKLSDQEAVLLALPSVPADMSVFHIKRYA